MKIIKRILSVILIIATLTVSLPLAAMAQESGVRTTVSVTPDSATANRVTGEVVPEGRKDMTTATSDELIYGEITRAQWLHNLAVVFGMTVETMAAADNYFSDLSEDHVYYTDIILATSFGVVDIEAGQPIYPDEPLTRDFAASTLNYCLSYHLEEGAEYTYSDHADCTDPVSAQIALNRGWVEVVEGAFCPTLTLTEAEVRAMLDDAASVLAATEIDENYQSTYGFAEDVMIVPDGTVASKDEDGTVTITDCPVEISAGDKFAVFYNSIPVVATALSAETVDGITTIETEAVASGEAFTAVDSQGKAYDMEFIPVGDTEISIDESSDGLARASGSKTIQSANLKGSYEILDGVEIFLDVTLTDPTVNYKVNEDYGYVALVAETEISYGITCDLASKGTDSITLAKVLIGGVGSFTLSVELELSATLNGTVSGMLTAGIEYTKAGGLRDVKSFVQTGSSCTGEATASIGLKASLGVTELPFVSAYIYIEMGIKAGVRAVTWTAGEESGKCVSFNGYLYGEYGGYASVTVGNWHVEFNPKVEFYHAGNSPVRIVHHYENDIKVAECTKGNDTTGYFTNSSSSYGGSGWNGCNGAYSVDSNGFQIPLYSYTVDADGNATITEFKSNYYTVNVPKEIDGHPVVGLGTYSFESKGMFELYLPNTLTYISNNAFQKCMSVKKVTIPEGVTKIYSSAFMDCSSLKQISLPDTVTSIDHMAFSGTAIKEIEIPASLDSCSGSVSRGPFYNCPELKTVTFEEGTTQVARYLFAGSDICEIYIPDTVTVIENNAFEECLNLTSVTIPDSVTTIEPYAFNNCSLLDGVILPDNLSEIGNNAFENCTSLTSIVIPDSVTRIYSSAFLGCSSLGDVTLSDSLTDLDHMAFSGTAIKEIEIPASLDSCSVSVSRGPFYNCPELKTVTFEEETTQVARYLFAGCDGLEEITIPDTVTVIENNAFEECLNLTSVTIPDSVTTIEPYAFNNCSLLDGVILPDSLSEIGNNAFENCTSLTSIVIPDSVTRIYSSAFLGCSSLGNVTLSDSLTDLDHLAFSGTGIKEIKIPRSLDSSTASVGSGPFYNCPELKTVTFEEGVTQVARYLFAGCDGLEEITIPGTVTVIENNAFEECLNLTSVTIPNSVISIEANAFKDCANLTIFGNAGSYAESYAAENGFLFTDTNPVRVYSVDNYTVKIEGVVDVKEIRFAPGHHTTGSEVKAAEGTLTLSASLVAANTDENGVFTYDVAYATEYTFWVRMNDGTGYFLYADTSDITTYLVSDGLRLTVTDMRPASEIKDMWIAEGTWTSYSEIKNNVSSTAKYQATSVKLANYFATNDFTYTTSNPGAHTVLIRYNDGTVEALHVTLTVDVPTFTQNGLQLTVGNIPGIKIIRTAYGEYNSVAEIKAASGVRNFNNKTVIKDAAEYMIQYRDEGVVTVIVEYNTGFKHIEHINITKKAPTVVHKADTVIFGDLEGLVMIRYALGEYTSSSAIKAAAGSKYVKPDAIDENGEIIITGLATGRYTFCVQYDDESYNYYTIVVD